MAEQSRNPDRHDTRSGVLGRPDPALRVQASRILAENGWTMNHFLIACLVLLTRNPAPFLARLSEFRPPAKKGRPRKRLDESSD
jgi:hypothetical protein